VQLELGDVSLQALDDRYRGVPIEVVDDEHLERPSSRSLDDAAKRGYHVLALVVDRDDDAQGRRLGAGVQIRPAAISSE